VRGREQPFSCCTANQRNEGAPPHCPTPRISNRSKLAQSKGCGGISGFPRKQSLAALGRFQPAAASHRSGRRSDIEASRFVICATDPGKKARTGAGRWRASWMGSLTRFRKISVTTMNGPLFPPTGRSGGLLAIVPEPSLSLTAHATRADP